LLVDIAQRKVTHDELTAELTKELVELDQRPAGVLLGKLRELGIPEALGAEVERVIARRNRLIHHFMEDIQVARAVLDGEGIEQVVDRVDQLSADIQRLINEIAAAAFPGAEAALGATIPELLSAVQTVDLDSIEDDALREQLRLVHLFGDHLK
jgi:hypothetical protein